MTRQSPRRNRSLPSVAVAVLGLIAVHPDARAAEMTTTAQMQMDHGGQSAMAGNATFKLGDLTVTSPWTRVTPGGAKIAGGYLKITNDGAASDRFVGAKSVAADHVEIHEMSMSDGVMKMRPLPNGLEIKPGETVELKSGGYHLMFMDLKQPLKQGDSLKATLQFEKAGSLDVNFGVNALGATGANAPQR
jgi:copper(I)-binding protein